MSGNTHVIGLIGWPVSHSFSPAMHNAAAQALGLDWVYVPLPVHPDDVETAVRGLPALGFRGVNVTVPHKQAVMPFLDEIEAGARAIGAVNTILIDRRPATGNRRLVGYNTDWAGFLADLEALAVDVAGRDCLILGAGGSARAVAYGLATAGGRVHVLARRVEQAEQLAAGLAPLFEDSQFSSRPLSELAAAVGDCINPLIVNTTSLGMIPDTNTSPWPGNLPFPENAFVYDLVYNPAETKLMQQAQAAGCLATNGLGMLVRQGALAFRLWAGQEPDVAVMAEAVRSMKSPS